MSPFRGSTPLRLCLFVLLSLALRTSPASAAEIRKASEPIRDRYIVTVAASTKDVDAVAKALAAQYDGKLLAVWKHALKGFWVELPADKAARLAKDARVATMEEDGVVHTSGSGQTLTGPHRTASIPDVPVCTGTLPSDPLWYLARISHRFVTRDYAIANKCAPRTQGGETSDDYYKYTYPHDGAGVKVYLIDTGVWKEHAELATQNVTHGYNAASNPDSTLVNLPAPLAPDTSSAIAPCNGRAPGGTDAGHGTYTAGVVVGRNLGVAKGVELVAVTSAACLATGVDRNFRGTAAILISAVDWVKRNAAPPAVVSMSTFRWLAPCTRAQALTEQCVGGNDYSTLENAVNGLVDGGIPVFASANNQAADACEFTPSRLSMRSGRVYGPPNGLRRTRVITVGGTDLRDRRWDTRTTSGGSNYGQCVDIFAPAAEMAIAYPDDEDRTDANQTPYGLPKVQSGTSFSAPIVAGLAARLLSEDDSLWIGDRATIADRVWERLKTNASAFEPPNLGLASPRLLAYLGGVTFLSQPPAQVFVAAAGSASFGVTVRGAATYEWFHGDTTVASGGDGATYQITNASATDAGEYWVRVRRLDNPQYYADSRRALVTVGAAAVLPRITANPTSVWTTPLAPVTLTATIESGSSSACFEWVQVTASEQTDADNEKDVNIVETESSAAQPGIATGRAEVFLNVNAPSNAGNVPTYRVVVKPAGTCVAGAPPPLWRVSSDTAQVRVCEPPPRPQLSGNGPYSRSKPPTLLRSGVDPTLKVRWYYAKGDTKPAETAFTPLRINHLTQAEKDLAGGASWSVFPAHDIVPPQAGWYAAVAMNSCGSSKLSEPVQVSDTCPFDLYGRTHIADEFHATPKRLVAQNSTVRLEAEPKFDYAPPDVTYSWIGAGAEGVTDAVLQTRPITGPTTYIAQATDKRSGCTRNVVFQLDVHPALPPVCTTIKLAGTYGRNACPVEPGTVIQTSPNMVVLLAARITDAANIEIPLTSDPDAATPLASQQDFTYAWFVGTQTEPVLSGTGLQFASYPYTVTSEEVSVRLEVTHTTGCSPAVLTFRVGPRPGSQPVAGCDIDPQKCQLACNAFKRRSVRSLSTGNNLTIIVFTPPQEFALLAPEETLASTYTWYRRVGTTETQIGTGEVITIAPDIAAEYYVVTNNAGGESISYHVVAVPASEVSPLVTVTPAFDTVVAGQTASFTATFANANEYTRYEWRESTRYDRLSSPIIGKAPTLNVKPYDNTTYWCRVIHPNSDGTETAYNSPFVSVTVNCTNVVSGVVRAHPQRVARGQQPVLVPSANGKLLVYTWTRSYPGNSTPVLESVYMNPKPVIAQPVTYFGATATDVCGQTGDLGSTTVYLCVPTITSQPTGLLVRPSDPKTLTVAATPAIDGQPLTVKWYRASDTTLASPLGDGWAFEVPVAAGTSDTFIAAITSHCDGEPNVLKSIPAIVEVCATPAFSVPVTSYRTGPGIPITLVTLDTSQEYTYQWYRGMSGDTSDPVAGATDGNLLIGPNVTTRYWMRATSRGLCTADGATITVEVCALPVITQQPQNVSAFNGKTSTLSVAATSSTQALTYQWEQLNASNAWVAIPGATASAYTTPGFTSDAYYRVRVMAGTCAIESATALVTRCSYAEVVEGGERKIGVGESASLSLPGMSPVLEKTITWYRGAVGDRTQAVVTATGTNLTYNTPPLTANATYWAEFSSGGCTSRTNAFNVTVCKPAVTTQPVSTTVVAGGSATLTIATTQIPGLTYQWYAGAPGTTTSPVANGTGTSLTVTPTATTSYWCRVSSSCALTADSAAATVSVCNPPVIANATTTQSIRAGQTTSVSVSATASNISYQWYRGATGVTTDPIAGATYGSTQVSPTTTTNYWCRLTSDGFCKTDTATMTVDVCTPPSITTQPAAQQTVYSGTPVTLSVAASSPRTMTYQWYVGATGTTSTPIAGATSASVTVTPTSNTSYWCRITSSVCTVDSNTAVVSMCALQPVYAVSNVNSAVGERVTLSLPSMTPSVSKNVTWYKGAVPDRSAPVSSGSGITFDYLTPAINATAQYWAELTHDGCVSRTDTYTITPCKPTITAQPQGTQVASGTPVTLAVTANGGPLTYQWFLGNPGDTTQPLAGKTTSSLSITPTATATYWVRVTGCATNINSVAATVSVCNPATISNATTTTYIQSGATTSIFVSAAGSNVSYQWYRGTKGVTTNPIAGATYGSTQVSPTTTTNYWCRITTDGLCTKDSETMTVDVCTPPSITTQPAAQQYVYSGTAVTLTVAASSTRTMAYQWYAGATGVTTAPIAGATTASLTVSPAANASYWCRVTSSVCSVDSNTAYVSMCAFQPSYAVSNVNATVGERVTLSLPSMSPSVDKDITWYKGSVPDRTVPVASATAVNLSYLTAAINTTAQYWAEFTHNGCVSRTDTYTITPCKPTITAQPQSTQQVASGTSVTLSVTANGGPLTYQWFLGNPGDTTQPLAGKTTSTLTVAPAASATYWVRVTGCSTSVNSTAATISVCNPAVIGSATTTKYIAAGDTTSVSVSATGSSIAYQWYRGTKGVTTNPIAGATYGSTQVAPAVTTNYWCRITTDGFCTKDTETMTVDVCTSPTITTQPAAQQSIFSGSSATLSIAASSSRAMTYQWYQGASGTTTSPIAGATSATLTVSPSADTSYWCRVTSSVCTEDSDTATVLICAYNPTYAVSNVNAFSGERVTLSLPSMSPVLTKDIKWYKGSAGDRTVLVASGSGTNLSYQTPALTATAQYWAEFSVGSCVSRTNTYTINVCKPTITAQPQNVTILSGNSTALTVAASGAPLTYQWYIGNPGDTTQPVSGQTASSFTVSPAATTTYWVRVTGCSSSADSAAVTVTVCAAPAITSFIKTTNHTIGSTGRFTITATGTNLTYQWYKGLSGDTSRPISGATAAIYEFTLQTSENYWVRVTSGCSGAFTNSITKMYSVDAKVTSYPADVTIPSGTSTTLKVTATGTYLTYQWVDGNFVEIPGATSSTFTTPALTATKMYGCRVGSGELSGSNPPTATVTVCQPPSITSYTATNASGSLSWEMKVTVSYYERTLVTYNFYRGVPGDVSQSVDLGVYSGGVLSLYNPPSGATYWARVLFNDGSCYADTAGKTIP